MPSTRTGQLKISLQHTLVHELRTQEGLIVPISTTRNYTPPKCESILLPALVLQDPSLCQRHLWKSLSQSTRRQLRYRLTNATDFDQWARIIASNVGSHYGYLLVVEMEMVTLMVTQCGDGGTELLDGQVIIDRMATTGLGSWRRRLGPVEKLGRTEHEVVEAGGDLLEEGCCSVCLEEYSKTEVVRFACTHVYHMACILKWLDKHDSCPLCRCQLYLD